MAEITLDREVLIYISNVDGALFPDDNLYPDNDLYPGIGTLIIESSEGNSGIVEGSLNIEELIVDSNLIFGQCISNKFECILYNIPYDIAGKDILVVALENGTQVPMFKGVIDSSVTDITSYERNLVAYDEFYYKRDKNVAEWWNEYWTSKISSSLKDIKNSLLNYMDIPYYEKELVNDDTVIKSTSTYSVLSFGDCLKMICELQGCFPNIDRTGTLDFVVLGENEINVSEGYEKNNAQFQDYKTTKITGIMVYSDATEITHTVGSTDNMYAITSNIFLEEMSASEVNTCVGNLLNAIKDIEYIPCDIPMILSDLEVEIGSKIVVDDKVTYALKNAYSGSVIVNQNITANASSEKQISTPDVVSSDKSVGRKISKVEHDLDGFRVEVGDEIEKTNSKLDIMSGQISAKVDYGDYTASVIIGKINDETPSGVQIEADKINLNGYVTVTDLETSGSTVINGSNITTGSINCNRLKGGTITGQVISGGTISGTTINGASGNFTKAFTVNVPMFSADDQDKFVITAGSSNVKIGSSLSAGTDGYIKFSKGTKGVYVDIEGITVNISAGTGGVNIGENTITETEGTKGYVLTADGNGDTTWKRPLARKTVSADNISISADSFYSGTISVTADSGYEVIAIGGFSLSNASSGGTGSSNCAVSICNVSSVGSTATVSYQINTWSSTAVKVKLTVHCIERPLS